METEHVFRSTCPGRKIGFANFSQPHYASEQFVEDLLYALVALGVNRLSLRGEPNRRLNVALERIHDHCVKMEVHYREQGKMERARAFRYISFAITPSSKGTFDTFWNSAARCHGLACWRIDGTYVLRTCAGYVNEHMSHLERNYASLVQGYARMIKRRLDHDR